jgi:diguanylate cyclase (GGDEF)-like protein
MTEKFSTLVAGGFSLENLQLFAGITDSGIAAIVGDCEIMRVAAGADVPNPHGPDARVYAVLHGALRTKVTSQDTHTAHEGTILPGESIGELSVLDEAAHYSALTALEDSVLLVIESPTMWRLIDEIDGVARNLLRLLSFRLRAANALLRRREKVGEFYRQLSMIDGLTGLQNRAWLDDRLNTMVEQAHDADLPLSVIMIDLDHFKAFNDTHGHPGGDSALRTAAAVLTGALRPSDFAVRYGGEELLVLLPDSSERAGMMVAQRLCDRMRCAVVFDDMRIPLPHITASFGVATLQPDQDADALLRQADAALYRAKNAGRNRIAC